MSLLNTESRRADTLSIGLPGLQAASVVCRHSPEEERWPSGGAAKDFTIVLIFFVNAKFKTQVRS